MSTRTTYARLRILADENRQPIDYDRDMAFVTIGRDTYYAQVEDES